MLNGKVSQAQRQRCIFCDGGVRNATVHVIGACSAWSVLRSNFLAAAQYPVQPSPDRICLDVLGASPGSAGFFFAVELCDAIDRHASSYWQYKGSDSGGTPGW